MKRIIIMSACTVLLLGCTTTQVRTTSVSDSSGSFKPETIDPLLDPNVEVGQRVTGNGSGGVFFFIFGYGDSAKLDGFSWGNQIENLPVIGGLFGVSGKEVLDYAVYDACKRSGADFLVAPRYAIVEDDYIFWKNYTVTATGFSGQYKGFRAIPYETRREWKMQEETKRMVIGGSQAQSPVNVTVDAQ